MTVKVSSLEEVGDVFMNLLGDYKQAILRDLWDNLMETTPEKTGTLRHNWRFNPYKGPGDYLRVNDGTNQPWPREPDEKVYKAVNISVMTIYNNSPYIVMVNNGESGNEANQNFIQRALAMTETNI